MEYYKKINKFFSFLNNRRIIEFNEIKLKKTEPVLYGFEGQEEILPIDMMFNLYITEAEETVDIIETPNCVRLENINKNYRKLYKEINKKNFPTYYYPTCEKDDSFVDNIKFSQISAVFESEFSLLMPKFKTTTSAEYKKIKDGLLKYLYNKKNKIKSKDSENLTKSQLKSLINYSNYFNKIIKKTDGNLEEKIIFSLNRYANILKSKRDELLRFYKIDKTKDSSLANCFIERRNKIAHGLFVEKFTHLEIISYTLVRLSIYCITLERCNFTMEEIEKIIKKIFR